MWNSRTVALIGEEANNRLKSSNVCVVGIGGVGGYVCQMLVRAGIENITLVDYDVVDTTNINRQVVANVDTVGKLKTEVMREMILKINPNCKVKVVSKKYEFQISDELFCEGKFDYVIDAIDSVKDKVDLIDYCKDNQINIVSAMGAGNRKDIPNFCVMDIYKTHNDGLAKVMRKRLRERGVSSLDVVTCTTTAERVQEGFIGSISYYPAMCGCVLSAYVINKLINSQNN